VRPSDLLPAPITDGIQHSRKDPTHTSSSSSGAFKEPRPARLSSSSSSSSSSSRAPDCLTG
jgi:hypothetical protein